MGLSVAILHYAGPPMIGGVEVTIAAHAKVLAAAGHQVRVIAGQGGALPNAEVLIDPLFSSRGELIDVVNRELAAGEAGPNFESLTAQIVERLAAALAGVDVAIVHNLLTLHKNLAFTSALHRLHQANLAPHLLAWCHDFAWSDPLYIPEMHPGYPWKLLKSAWPGAAYVVVSQDRQAMLAELLGIPVANITVATPGIDLAGFLGLGPEAQRLVQQLNLLAADPLLLLPARVTRRKNIELAIEIIGALQQLGLRPQLLVSGPPGPHNPTNAAYLAQLQALRQASGTDLAITFLYEVFTDPAGRPLPVSDTLLSQLYRLADGLLFPSRAEGFGIPVLEAGLVGIPIFCSDIAPFRETAGDAALYFDPSGSPTVAAAQIAAALQNDRRYQLRRRVRLEYTWEAIYQRVIAPLLVR